MQFLVLTALRCPSPVLIRPSSHLSSDLLIVVLHILLKTTSRHHKVDFSLSLLFYTFFSLSIFISPQLNPHQQKKNTSPQLLRSPINTPPNKNIYPNTPSSPQPPPHYTSHTCLLLASIPYSPSSSSTNVIQALPQPSKQRHFSLPSIPRPLLPRHVPSSSEQRQVIYARTPGSTRHTSKH